MFHCIDFITIEVRLHVYYIYSIRTVFILFDVLFIMIKVYYIVVPTFVCTWACICVMCILLCECAKEIVACCCIHQINFSACPDITFSSMHKICISVCFGYSCELSLFLFHCALWKLRKSKKQFESFDPIFEYFYLYFVLLFYDQFWIHTFFTYAPIEKIYI